MKINPIADKLIKLAGGVPNLAKLLGISERWIYKWRHSREEGGSSGNVPSTHHKAVLKLAKARNWPITAEDLLIDG